MTHMADSPLKSDRFRFERNASERAATLLPCCSIRLGARLSFSKN